LRFPAQGHEDIKELLLEKGGEAEVEGEELGGKRELTEAP